jgi:hypothetical protein
MSREELLWQACSGSGDLETVKHFVSSTDPVPVDVNWADPEWGRTPFYRACWHGHLSIVQYLLAACPSVDVNKENNEGSTPLYVACSYNHLEVVRVLLLDPRVEVNKTNVQQASPFNIATELGYNDIISLLLGDDRININQQDDGGCSGVWMAAQNGRLETLQLILASDRDIDLSSKSTVGPGGWHGKTAVEIARWSGSSLFPWNDESEEDFKRRKAACPIIADLLAEHQRDPHSVRKRLSLLPGVRDRFIGEVFAMVVFLADNFVSLQPAVSPLQQPPRPPSPLKPPPLEEQARRFFAIAVALPMDLQMVLCNKVFDSPKDLVLTKHSEPAFKKLAKPTIWRPTEE